MITRETLVSLVGPESVEQDAEADEPTEDDADGSGPDLGSHDSPAADSAASTSVHISAGSLEREATRERALVLLAGAAQAMHVKDIAAAIGEDVSGTSNGRRVETTRSRLKALVREGRLVEEPTAWFAIAPVSVDGQRRGDARE